MRNMVGGLGAQCNYREVHFNYFVKGKAEMSTAGEGQHQGLRPNKPTDPKEAENRQKHWEGWGKALWVTHTDKDKEETCRLLSKRKGRLTRTGQTIGRGERTNTDGENQDERRANCSNQQVT